MSRRFSSALITGGGSGIGLALCQALATQHCEVLAADRCFRHRPASQRIRHIELDLRRNDAVAQITALCSRPFDLVAHCAAISAVGRFEHIAAEDLAAVAATNLIAPLQITHDLLKGHVAASATHVFIVSLCCSVGYPGAAAYAASKDGLEAFARCLRARVASAGGSVLIVYPGPTDTPHARAYSPDQNQATARMSPQHVATSILRAAAARRLRLTPGVRNRLFSTVGVLAPRLTTRAMASWLLPRLKTDQVLRDPTSHQTAIVSKGLMPCDTHHTT